MGIQRGPLEDSRFRDSACFHGALRIHDSGFSRPFMELWGFMIHDSVALSWSFRGFSMGIQLAFHGALEDSVWGFSRSFMEL